MKPPFEVRNLERTGFAIVLREQSESLPDYGVYADASAIEVNLSRRIAVTGAAPTGISQFLFTAEASSFAWLPEGLLEIGRIASGANKGYADLALRQASHVTDRKPLIYSSPEGGVVFEHQLNGRMLTLVIEDALGVLVGSSDHCHANERFEINAHSINELLARYLFELKLLHASGET